ncbi:MAG: hypothetical protein ACFKPT_22760 [Gloeotrichia echinulata GP01]
MLLWNEEGFFRKPIGSDQERSLSYRVKILKRVSIAKPPARSDLSD